MSHMTRCKHTPGIKKTKGQRFYIQEYCAKKRPDPFREERIKIPATGTGSQESGGKATWDKSQLGPQRRQGNKHSKDRSSTAENQGGCRVNICKLNQLKCIYTNPDPVT